MKMHSNINMKGLHILNAVFTPLVQSQMEYCEGMWHYEVRYVRGLNGIKGKKLKRYWFLQMEDNTTTKIIQSEKPFNYSKFLL